MRFSYKIAIIFIFSATTSIISQEKLKGNKVVTIEDRNISDFTKIEVIDDINIFLVYNDNQSVTVEADSNLQPVILTEVKGGILTIRTSEVIGRSKELNVHIKVNKNITSINAYNNTSINSNNSLIIDNLTINAFDTSDFSLKLNSKNLTINGKTSSKFNFEILSTDVTIKTESSSELKATINTQNIALEISDKSVITLIGNSNDLSLESYSSASFKGKGFITKNATIQANNDTNISINASETLNVSLNNTSELNVYSNPAIIINEFNDKALLRKKEL
jgi:hypothetical protein